MSKKRTAAQRAAAREYYHRNKAAKKAKSNGSHDPNDLVGIVKSYQRMYAATNDESIKLELTKCFAAIIYKMS